MPDLDGAHVDHLAQSIAMRGVLVPLPPLHKDTARKAFERIVRTMLPADHKQLQRGLAAEVRAYNAKADELAQRANRSPRGHGVRRPLLAAVAEAVVVD